MRSLWRFMASQWLGGEGSEVLTGDSALLDLLLPEQPVPAFRMRREQQACIPVLAAASVPGGADREDVERATSHPG
jgi:hypothetical protein